MTLIRVRTRFSLAVLIGAFALFSSSGAVDAQHLETPTYRVREGAGNYTGFNSLDLQQILVVEKKPAVRSQIARGWGKPVIVRISNGELLASQYKNLQKDPNPRFPGVREEAAISRSVDEGITWSVPRLLNIPGRVTQFSALKNDTLILAAGGQLYRSQDRGMTWAKSDLVWQPPSWNGQSQSLQFDETNGVIELPNGTLFCGAYSSLEPGRNRSYLLRSTDQGLRWSDGSFVADASEISYLALPSGKILGFARTPTNGAGEGGALLTIVESVDGGRQWTSPRRFGLGMAQIPGFPLRLPDGRLLLIYGNRQFPFGVQAIASLDEGKTWLVDRPIFLSWFSWDSYCGHPRSILMPDGSVMTGYYTRVFQEGTPNEDIVSHAVRWRVPAAWPNR